MSKQQGYITELSAIESVRKRSSLFIGANGINQLLIEATTNAIDEILAERNNKVNVFYNIIDDDNIEYYCQDWSNNGIPLKTKNGEDGIISIATKLFSGAKYDSSLYFTGSGGTNGVGLLIINSLCKQLIITTLAHNENNNHIRYIFKDGIFIKKELVDLTSYNNIYSTEIKFIPDKKYFKDGIIVDDQKIIDLLKLARYIFNDDIELYYKDNVIENTYLEDFKGENCIEYINDQNINKKTKEYCKIGIALYNDFDSGKIFKGIVNSLSVDNGTHKNIIERLLKNKLFEIAEKNKKHVQINDLLMPIRIICTLQIKDTDYKEQVKDTLDADKEIITKLVEPCIDLLIKNNKDFFNKVINFSEEYRVSLEANKKARKSKNGSNIKISGLFDCASKNSEERTLYIVEGISAASTIVKVRNPYNDAILALRGKVLNVLDNSTKKILENDVINSIAGALGYKIFGKIDPENCRYKRGICIVADGDSDGRHIECLIIHCIYKLFPELIKAGLIYIIVAPKYGCWINKKFIPIYNEEDRKKYLDKNVIVRRFKGLGEMNEKSLYESILNPLNRECLQLKYEDFDIMNVWENEMGILNWE